MYASGSAARQTTVTDQRPCDAVIMGIVDTWDVDGEVAYQKDED
jgi:ethanolamine utilization protein EutN/carbon dioxide concentrating mechanism protein CcmL